MRRIPRALFLANGFTVTVERLDRLRAKRRTRPALPLVAGALVGLLVLAGLALRESFERTLFLRELRSLTGATLNVDSVRREGDLWRLAGVHLRTRGGAALIDADRAGVAERDGVYEVTLERPRFAFLPDRYRGDELRVPSLAGSKVSVRVRDGTLAIAAGAVPSLVLYFRGIDGTLRVGGAGLAYDVTMHLDGAGQDVVLTGRSRRDVLGGVAHHWSAPVLPLVTAGTLLPQDCGLQATGGWLRDLEVDDGGSLDASARLEDANFALGASHVASGLDGQLRLTNDGLGTPLLAGRLDGVPLSLVGEVHDLPSRFRWLLQGSNDLRSVERLLLEIANEPDLQSVHLDTTANGIVFAQYGTTTEHGPLAVSVLSVDPREPTVHFDTALAGDRIVSGGERTSAMGVRTRAVAGVNGDYFDIGRTYQPQGVLVRSGELLRGPTDRAALVIDRANKVTFAEFKLRGAVRAERATFPVTQLNNWPAGNVTVITPAFGAMLPPAPGVTFAKLVPLGAERYRVASVEPVNEPVPVTFGIAFGPLAHASLHVGETLELSYRLDPPADGAVAGIGGGPFLLRNGAWYEDAHAPAPGERDVRWPVMALGRESDDRLLFVAVDGRHPERSVGMTRPEFGALLRRFGIVDAMALDSGGSVTMVSRAPGDANVTVRNVPSDSSAERWVSDALFIYSTAPAPGIIAPRGAPTPVPEMRPTP
jgi:hypothetical protein